MTAFGRLIQYCRSHNGIANTNAVQWRSQSIRDRVLATTLRAGERAQYTPTKARHLYLVPAAGKIEINGIGVNARDGVAIRDEAALKITALEDSELVLVDAA